METSLLEGSRVYPSCCGPPNNRTLISLFWAYMGVSSELQVTHRNLCSGDTARGKLVNRPWSRAFDESYHQGRTAG